MGRTIGKVIATEKSPSTIDDFYFWTKSEMILNPFDVVKVTHLQNSVSYGVIEEISHITDTAKFLADTLHSNSVCKYSFFLSIPICFITISSQANSISRHNNR